LPSEANDVVQWFEDNYVNGRIRRQLRNGNVIRNQPLFPPALWSVYDSMELGIPRTQNVVEAWHRRWETLVGESHVGVFTTIKELQKEQLQVGVQIERIFGGEQRPKQKKMFLEKERRITTIMNNRESYDSVMDFFVE